MLAGRIREMSEVVGQGSGAPVSDPARWILEKPRQDADLEKILSTLSKELGWSHFVELLPLSRRDIMRIAQRF